MWLPFFGGWDRKIRKLRKKWDREREKALRKKSDQRLEILSKLDIVEDKLKMLEERELTRVDKARIAKEVEIELAGVEAMMSGKD